MCTYIRLPNDDVGAFPPSAVLHVSLFIVHLLMYIHRLYRPTLYPVVDVSIGYIAIPCLEIETRRTVASCIAMPCFENRLQKRKILYSLLTPRGIYSYKHLTVKRSGYTRAVV